MIDIRDFKFNIICDYDNRGMAKHSIGAVNAPVQLRTNVCNQCLLEIISEGLKRITEEERAEILKEYMPSPKMLTNEEGAIPDNIQGPTGEEGETIQEEENNAQPDAGAGEEPYNPIGRPRAELIGKAKELGVEGKYATFNSKMLEKEIIKKLGGK